MSLTQKLKKIYSKQRIGRGYEKYADRIFHNYTKLKREKQNFTELEKLCIEYYVKSLNAGNKKCIKKLADVYIQQGNNDELHKLFTETEYYETHADCANTSLFRCAITMNKKELVELYFDKIEHKTSNIYFSVACYHKKTLCDCLAIKYFKLASNEGHVYANYMVGTWYMSQGDKLNATKYFLKILSYKRCYIQKIDALYMLFKLKKNQVVLQFVDQELLQLEKQLQHTNFTDNIVRYKKCYLYLKARVLIVQNKLNDAHLIISDLYEQFINKNVKFNSMEVTEIVQKINNLYKKNLHIFFGVDLLIWFEYNLLDEKLYHVFQEHESIIGRINSRKKLLSK